MAAAARWGCDWVEIKEPVIPGVHPYWQKALAYRVLGQYERVLQLDCDMLVNRDCPSPFDYVPEDHLGVVSAHQYVFQPVWVQGRNRCIAHWSRFLGVKHTCPDERHLNGGFFLYHTRHQRELLDYWTSVGERSGWTKRFLPEQACLSVILWQGRKKWKQTWLPHTFNTVGVVQKERHDHNRPQAQPGPMKSWIYHYTGGPTKAGRIDTTWWNTPLHHIPLKDRSKEIVARLPQGPCRMVEVGVLRGMNAYMVLSNHSHVHLTLADPWRKHETDSSYVRSEDGNCLWETDDWRCIFTEAVDRINRFYGRWSLLHVDSHLACRAVEDGSVDLVFIDADHSYEGCSRDIQCWRPKVKPGGWIGGHDYGVKWTGKWGVAKAVDEHFPSGVIKASDFTWWVRVE